MAGEIHLGGRMRGALRGIMPAALNIAQRYGGEFKPLVRGGLSARCWRDWPNDAKFMRRWQGLMARDPQATVFAGPVWQSAVIDEFVPAGNFRLITVQRKDELLAMLPLSINTASMLETPGRGVTDYLDPLVDAESAEKSWGLILELLSRLWDWSVIGLRLQLNRADSPAREILKSLAPRFGFEYLERRIMRAPYIALPGTWEEYLASLDGHERKELKRKIRNAETKGRLRWQTHATADAVTTALERALSAMRQAESEKADFTEEVLIGFLRRVCPRLTRQGDFYMHELSIEDKPTAWLLCLRSRQGPMMYNTGYDPSQKHWSPGIVSFGLAIRDAIAAGQPIFNLLRGGEQYKHRLGGKDVDLFRITLTPR
jgi:CelD/BcsL family acetyltransferase involved in cellulose biosynthesis